MLETLVTKLINQSYLDWRILARLKRQYAKKFGKLPRNSAILTSYKRLVKQGKVNPKKSLEDFLRLKKIRTLSGIAPVAVLTKPYPCPGQCVYCPTEAKTPKSYLSDEPAVMRAQMAGFDPYKQVSLRLEQLQKIGHSTDKIELIVMGGTFSSLPKQYQSDFIRHCFNAANHTPGVCNRSHLGNINNSKNLKETQKQNETAKNRIVGLTLETRPDMIDEKEIKWFRQLGCTRVEIGVQSIYNNILKKVKRGHPVEDTIRATKLLKDAGLKVCYHMMPNLPGATLKNDLKMFRTIFNDSRFMPDMLKIYPCVVAYKSELYDWYKKKKYKPYTDKELIELLIKIKQLVPEWVRINRLVRDIPVANIAAGSKISNLRQVLHAEMSSRGRSQPKADRPLAGAYGRKCSCIRCREIRNIVSMYRYIDTNNNLPNLKFGVKKYKASGGFEYFLQYIDENNILYALLRLRISSQNIAFVRELHTFGEAVPIAKRNSSASQHKGLGKKLLKKAEDIVQQKGLKIIVVASGVGAREYYRKQGYRLQDSYMAKGLS